jgi:hypothetical protein
VAGAIPPDADRPFRVGLALTMPGVSRTYQSHIGGDERSADRTEVTR